MNVAEAEDLILMIAGLCPAQHVNENTPDAWALVLRDIPGPVAKWAAVHVASTKPYVAACDIVQVAHRMRVTTRRAIKQAARDAGVIPLNVEAEADAAIAAGAVDFSGIDLMGRESPEARNYAPEVARVTWAPRREVEA